MVLDYLGVSVEEDRLRRILGATEDGTPFPHIERLQALGLFITYGKDGDLPLFEDTIELGLPVVVGVTTFTWPHWDGEVTQHAVAVVGIDRARGVIYINDPFFPQAPIEMELVPFETGWEELNRQYAVISLAPPEDMNE
jgi:hypothetical protein